MIFKLHGNSLPQTVGATDISSGFQREQMHENFQNLLKRSAEKVRRVSETARKRQAIYEEESGKTMKELQEQRRQLMQRLVTFLNYYILTVIVTSTSVL